MNTPPSLGGAGITSNTYLENFVNNAPRAIDTGATVSDAEGNFNGGNLVVSGLNPLDFVTVHNQGTGAGQIGYSSGSVTYENTQIGVVGVGYNQTGSGENLEIIFNSSATTAGVDALLQNLRFGHGNTADNPTNTSSLTLTLTDAAGASANRTVNIAVTPQAEDGATIGGATNGDDTLVGTAGADVILALGGNDILNGNGGADELRGSGGNDILAVSTADFELLQGGNGQDTLRLDGGLDLDLTSISNLRINNIETINLRNADSSTLTLDIFDVFDISGEVNTALQSALAGQQAGLNVSNANNLLVSGGNTDVVNLVAAASDGTWQDTGQQVTVNTQLYDVVNYTTTAGDVLATVAIDTDITTNGTV